MATELFENETADGTLVVLTDDCNIGDEVLHVNKPAAPALQPSDGQSHWILINPFTGEEEIIIVTANAWSSTWTITRAADSTTQHVFPQGSVAKHILTRDSLSGIIQNVSGGTKLPYLDITLAPYNCKGDCGSSFDGAMTAGDDVLYTAGAPNMKVGMKAYVSKAGNFNTVLQTTVVAIVDSLHVQLADANQWVTFSGGEVVYGTDNHDGFVAALATGRSLFVPNSTGQYLIDVGEDSSKSISIGNPGQKIIGESRDGAVLRLGPEGTMVQNNSVLFEAFGSVYFQDITLQGQDVLGNNGPSADPGVPGTSTRNYGISMGGSDGEVRLLNCHLKKFVFPVQINTTVTQAGISADFTWFEGYGNSYRSMCIAATNSLDAGGWNATKRVRVHHCRFSGFGDPTGGNLYHAIYASTSFALDIGGGSYFHTSATTSTGAVVQHYDSNIGPGNAAPVSKIIDTDFGWDLAAMSGVLTSYNCETVVMGCTFDQLQDASVNVAGPVIVSSCTFIASASLANPFIQMQAQGQSTGLTWSAQIINNRFRGSATTNGMNCVKINRTTSTSDFKIIGNDFDGCTSSSAIYVLVFGSSTVVGGTVEVSNNRFAGNPGACISASSSSTAVSLAVKNNRFYTLSSTKCIKNDTTLLARLAVINNDFSNASAADVFSLTAGFPTTRTIRGSYGSSLFRDSTNGNYSNTPGAVSSITFPHNLGNNPNYLAGPTLVTVVPFNAAARDAPDFFITADSINITMTFASPLLASTQYIWNFHTEFG